MQEGMNMFLIVTSHCCFMGQRHWSTCAIWCSGRALFERKRRPLCVEYRLFVYLIIVVSKDLLALSFGNVTHRMEFQNRFQNRIEITVSTVYRYTGHSSRTHHPRRC